MLKDDALTMAAGAMAWSIAVPAVSVAGRTVANGGLSAQLGAVVVGVGIASCTTPLMSSIMGWKTQYEKVRGIALALGTAQVIDGLVHLFAPTFYSADHKEGLAGAGNIFFGAGLLGIFSAYA